MSHKVLYRLGGLALILGGLSAATAHMLHIEAPADPAQLAHYAYISQPVHLLLFAGGILVLLGWFAQFAFQSAASGVTGLLAFLTLFFGILFADLLHCILEFSIFPILISSVPYATPALAETTYRSTPFATLQDAGQLLGLIGIPLFAFSTFRSRVLPSWCALPFVLTSALMILAFLPGTLVLVGPHYVTALYLSMMTLGVAMIREQFRRNSSESEQRGEFNRQEKQMPYGR